MAKVLHAGCGSDTLPAWMPSDTHETRLDINQDVSPDICASLTDLGDIGTYDMVYCSHALEHLTRAEVEEALSEFKRVLRDKGVAMVVVPDLTGIKPNDEVIYTTPSGYDITGIDLFMGINLL